MKEIRALQHTAVTLPVARLQWWLVADGEREPNLDMRSVFDSLGMSWPRWRLYLLGSMARLRINHSVNRAGKKTLVMPRENAGRLLIELHNTLGAGLISRNIGAALPEWQQHWANVQALQRSRAVATASEKRSRKLAAEKVQEIYALYQADTTIKAIAGHCDLSESVVKKVIAGTYQSFDGAALAKWLETFGKLKADKRHIGLKPSTITAELIEKVFVLHRQNFKPAYIAQCLAISVTPVNQIIRGTYISRDPLAEPKWASTFGAVHGAEKAQA